MVKSDKERTIFVRGLIFVIQDFSWWTSTHGIPHIGLANARWLRFAWGIVVLTCLGGFIWQFIILLTKYLAYNVNTETELHFGNRVFPTVTICHLNPWKKSETMKIDKKMESLVKAYEDLDADGSKYGFSNRLDGVRQQRATKFTALRSEVLYNKSKSSNTNRHAYSYDDLVISCTYNAKVCELADFQEFYDPTYGVCQMFNFAGNHSSSRAGPLYGLRMVIRTDQAKYLPWTETAGVVISIHGKKKSQTILQTKSKISFGGHLASVCNDVFVSDWLSGKVLPAKIDHFTKQGRDRELAALSNQADERPFPDVFGYFASPGVATSMGVRFMSTHRLPKPYGTCTTQKLLIGEHYNGTYEVESCFRNCLQKKIIADCGCYDPSYPFIYDGTTSSCDAANDTLAKLDCIDKIANADSAVFNLIRDCDCPQPCKIESYAATASTARWPSKLFKPSECFSTAPFHPWVLLGVDCIQWYKKNTLLIEIYYERMNSQALTESPAYSLVNLISDVGGQVGLFLGMSIISVIEFATLILLLLCYCATHKSRRMEIEEIEMEGRNAKENAERLAERNRMSAYRRKGVYGDDDGNHALPPAVIHSN